MRIPPTLYTNNTFHRSLNGAQNDNNIISCGFLYKPDASFTDKDCIFTHYGALLLLSGSGVYYDTQGVRRLLSPGCFIQRIPGRPHTTLVDATGDWLEFFVCFGRETYETLLHLGLLSDSPVIEPGLSPELLAKCTGVLHQFCSTPEAHTALLYTAVQNFAIEMHTASRLKQAGSACFDRMDTARELLARVTPSLISPQEAALHIHRNYESFRKAFRCIYGISPSAYQMNCRISHSMTLLLETRKSLNEIALICSFSDAFSFSKAFRKRCGVSPGQFRMQ